MGLEQLEKSWLSCVLLPIYASNLGQLFQNENITDDNIVLESVYKDMPVNFLDGLTYLIRRASITFFLFLLSHPKYSPGIQNIIVIQKNCLKNQNEKRLIDNSPPNSP